jgi:A/G-specific adenine glycosylase
VLVSEAMAQQTQIPRVTVAWAAWLRRFPTVEALAGAPVADVLRQWAGLGYNQRALNLHRAALAIVADHGGRVPDTVEGLESLPGVGPYTARAVAAIAFGRPVGAIDTNVRRVLGRIAAGGREAIGMRAFQALADAWVPADRPAEWTHALMDLGSQLCVPRRPRCADCPAIAWCRYAAGERPSADAWRVRRADRPGPAFVDTTRWLRGRVLDRARAAGDGEWVAFDRPIGSHPAGAVAVAVRALAAEGLLEARESPAGPEARLPS